MRNYLKINSLCIVFLIISKIMNAQTLRGVVISDVGDTLVGATVGWANSQDLPVVTDVEGKFLLKNRPNVETPGRASLQVTYVGFDTLTTNISPSTDFIKITLKANNILGNVTVAAQRGHTVSTLATRSMEMIGQSELRKDACCNLSESFERSGTVDVSYQDGVTGAKEIQMLGLRGIYTQLQVENRQSYNGLATPFALEYLPGSWLESIQISKGVGSVVNGFGGITGSVNAELQKPAKDKKVFLNLYYDGFQRVEGNLHLNKVVSPQLSTGLLLHVDDNQKQVDLDGDGFLNLPLKRQFNGLYRLNFDSDLVHAQVSLHGIRERRRGGQLDVRPNAPPSISPIKLCKTPTARRFLPNWRTRVLPSHIGRWGRSGRRVITICGRIMAIDTSTMARSAVFMEM